MSFLPTNLTTYMKRTNFSKKVNFPKLTQAEKSEKNKEK